MTTDDPAPETAKSIALVAEPEAPARSGRRRRSQPLDHRPTHASMTVELPQAVRDRVDEIADALGAKCASEVVRRAVAAFGAMVDAQRAGGSLVVRAKDGSETKILVF